MKVIINCIYITKQPYICYILKCTFKQLTKSLSVSLAVVISTSSFSVCSRLGNSLMLPTDRTLRNNFWQPSTIVSCNNACAVERTSAKPYLYCVNEFNNFNLVLNILIKFSQTASKRKIISQLAYNFGSWRDYFRYWKHDDESCTPHGSESYVPV
jgi:hypothetical protein